MVAILTGKEGGEEEPHWDNYTEELVRSLRVLSTLLPLSGVMASGDPITSSRSPRSTR
jgi:hypothetical protein